MLEIRRVQPADLSGNSLEDQVLAGDEVTVRIGRSGFSLSYSPAPRAEWRVFPPAEETGLYLQLAGETSVIYAAYQQQRLAGVAAVTVSERGWGRLLDLRVDVHQRRAGVGTALLAACDEFARRKGMGGLWAAVPDTNPVMCQFLEHSGFGVQGLDRMALALTAEERRKPMQQRACMLHFYRTNEKG